MTSQMKYQFPKSLIFSISLFYLNCNAFELFSNEIIVEAKMCSIQPCSNARFSYTIKNNKIVQKIELFDDKRKIVGAEINILDDCKIVDYKNWNCNESSKQYGLMINVVNGIYYPQPSTIKDIKWTQIK